MKAMMKKNNNEEELTMNESTEVKTKVCPRCGRELPVTSYWKNKQTKDGLFTYCIDCAKENDRRNYYKRKNGKEMPLAKIIRTRTMKKCSRCGSLLPLSEFYVKKRNPDGHNYYCKKCVNQMVKASKDKKMKDETINQNVEETSMKTSVLSSITVNPDYQDSIVAKYMEEKDSPELINTKDVSILKGYTARQLMHELKMRGYVWDIMTITVTSNISYDKI